MAYFNLFAAVPVAEIVHFRDDPAVLLSPSRLSGCSHLLAYWVEAQPLGGLLARALDGGDLLHPKLWHPFRPPLVHGPVAVRDLAESIAAVTAYPALSDDDWLAAEVGRLLGVFHHAAAAGESIVSVIDVPGAEAAGADPARRLWTALHCGPETPRDTLPERFKALVLRYWSSGK